MEATLVEAVVESRYGSQTFCVNGQSAGPYGVDCKDLY